MAAAHPAAALGVSSQDLPRRLRSAGLFSVRRYVVLYARRLAFDSDDRRPERVMGIGGSPLETIRSEPMKLAHTAILAALLLSGAPALAQIHNGTDGVAPYSTPD